MEEAFVIEKEKILEDSVVRRVLAQYEIATINDELFNADSV